MSLEQLSRRNFIRTSALGGAALGLGLGATRPALAAETIVGVVYVGPRDDFGWNQAHAVAIANLKSVPGVKVIEEENVPETAAVEKSMESMISLDGAKLILATSFGYFDPFMLNLAKKYPDTTFRWAGPLYDKSKHPANAGGYFGYLDQAHYVNGVAAGAASKTGKIGFVAAKPIGTVLRNINSVLMGARTVNPAATVQVIFTGDWSLPVREAEAANALVDAGCDVLTCHVDGPKVVIETAEKRGIMCCGHNASQAPLAPKGFLTGAEYKWETIYKMFAGELGAGKTPPNVVFGGYDSDMVQNTAYGAAADDKVKAACDAAIASLKAKTPLWKGDIKDNTGKVALSAPAAGFDNYAPELEGMNFLIDGVVGSIT
jgi:basic membrane protein A and related proteins